MFNLFRHHRILLCTALVLSFFASLLTIAMAFILERILNATVSGNGQLFSTMLVQTIVYLVVMSILAIASQLVDKKLIVRCVQTLRDNLYRGIIERDPEQFSKNDTAHYLSALTNDVKIIEENMLLPLVQALQGVFVFIMAAVALFFYNPFIGLITLLGLAAIYLLPSALGSLIAPRQQAYSNLLASFTATLKEHFSGYEVMHSFALIPRFERESSTLNAALMRTKYSVDRLVSYSEGLSQMLGVSLQLIVMLITAYLVMNGQLEAGALLAILQLSGCLVQPVALILQNLPKIQGSRGVLAKLNELATPAPPHFRGKSHPTFDRQLKTENLCFGFSETTPLIKNLNLTVQKGEKCALVGASGCGKTTLISLLMAHYSGYTGDIVIDDQNLRDLNIAELEGFTSVIHQEVFLFNETIKDNISLHREYSEAAWHRALAQSGVESFLSDVEQGINTPVGEAGSQLSGGQRQRIALARALIQNKPLLILDEATSAVDAPSALAIERTLLSLEEITVLSITHNLNPTALRLYDRVLYMKDGCIKEQGSYDDLMNNRAFFFEYQQGEAAKRKQTEIQVGLSY